MDDLDSLLAEMGKKIFITILILIRNGSIRRQSSLKEEEKEIKE